MKTLSGLSTEYNGFTRPLACIYVDGNLISGDFVIKSLEAELSIYTKETGAAHFTVSCEPGEDGNPDTKLLLSSFPLMKKIRIEIGYEESELQDVFEGYIFERKLVIEPLFPGELYVSCLDCKALLRLNNAFTSYPAVAKYSELVSNVLSKYSAETQVDNSEAFDEPIVFNQNGLTDFDLIATATAKTGFEFFAQGGKIFFRKRGNEKLLSLSKEGIFKAEYSNNLSGLYSDVKVIAYNRDNKEKQTISAADPNKIGNGKTCKEILSEDAGELSHKEQVNFGTLTQIDLNGFADAIFFENSIKLTEVTLHTKGIPILLPGYVVELEDIGDGIDNEYYIFAARHKYDEKGYSSEIVCRSNTTVY
ncbi:MAG: hypothetical protein FWE27_00115 [Defluviitaleaceae bacterium]|nr:hypothetical protein [Defluviitaleaceae bacterium]